MLETSRRLMVAVAVLTLSAAVRESRGQTVPYKAHGTGIYSPITGDFSGSGVGTHLGALTFFGNVATTPTANPLVFQWHLTGPQATVAANGDELVFTGSGHVELIPLDQTFTTFTAIWTGEYVVYGGTGRFANARTAAAPIQVLAINDPFTFQDPEWSFSWQLDGEIVLH